MEQINNINQESKFLLIGGAILVVGATAALYLSYTYESVWPMLSSVALTAILCVYVLYIAPKRAKSGASFIPTWLSRGEKTTEIIHAGNTLIRGKEITVMFRVTDTTNMSLESLMNLLKNSVPAKSKGATMSVTGLDVLQKELQNNIEAQQEVLKRTDSKTKRINLQFIVDYYKDIIGKVPDRGVWIRFRGKRDTINRIHFSGRSGIISDESDFEQLLEAVLREGQS
ncbi:MAG: hypothetical protein KAI72_00795 [Candidatus Pacebacteria bacterium]|nr:hypothetical protein [Candidatus Paceibacterota bacterium]